MRRAVALSVPGLLVAATLVAAGSTGPSAPVAATAGDCAVVDPSESDFDRPSPQLWQTDGGVLGSLPLMRTILPDGTYADYRASTDLANVPNAIVIGDVGTGVERRIYEFGQGGNVDRYLFGLELAPGGDHLMFIGGDGLTSPLVVIDKNGNETLRTTFPVEAGDAAFSPDGSQIVYASDLLSQDKDVFLAPSDGSAAPTKILDPPPNFALPPYTIPHSITHLRWSPDGSRLVFQGRNGISGNGRTAALSEVYLVDPDGTDLQQVPETFINGFETAQTKPVWSPDGSEIAFTQAITEPDGSGGFDRSLSLARLNVSANTVTTIAGSDNLSFDPQRLDVFWTGDRIVFVGSVDLFGDTASRRDGVFSFRVTDGDLQQLYADDSQVIDPDVLAGVVPCSILAPVAFVGLEPSRLMDTRNGTGVRSGLLGPGETVSLDVTGKSGVPPTGVDAIALNVTVNQTTQASFLTVSPAGAPRPTASNLNWDGGGVTKANMVIVKVGDGGRVDFFNRFGSTHVIADVAGWFGEGSGFTAIEPTRFLDTRRPIGVPAAGPLDRSTLDLAIHGPTVPNTATGVIMNLTAAQVAGPGFVTVFGSGQTDPGTSNLNMSPGRTSSNLVFSGIGTNGAVTMSNPRTSAHLIADVAGYLEDGSGFTGQIPSRIVDTRTAGRPLGSAQTLNVPLRGVSGGVPESARVAVLNVTAVRGRTPSFLTVYPGSNRPDASNVNFGPNEVVPNLVLATIGRDGSVNIFNRSGNVDVVVDVLGWFG